VQNRVNRSGMESLLQEIYDLRTRTYRLFEYLETTEPGPPATEAQIRAVEDAFRIALPHSYRLFLSIHDGWEHWSGDVALLSTQKMLAGKYAERINEWRTKNAPSGPVIKSAFVIGFSLFVGEQIFVDYSDPDWRVVIWEHREIECHTDFYDYLLSFKRILEQGIANEPI
jgi:SMI1 / KNR4 family (SUKH-1)